MQRRGGLADAEGGGQRGRGARGGLIERGSAVLVLRVKLEASDDNLPPAYEFESLLQWQAGPSFANLKRVKLPDSGARRRRATSRHA